MSHACAQGLTDVVAELVRRHAYVNTVDKVKSMVDTFFLLQCSDVLSM